MGGMRKARSDTGTDDLIAMFKQSRHWLSGELFDSNDIAKHCCILQARGSQVVGKMMSNGDLARTYIKGSPKYRRQDTGKVMAMPWRTTDNGVRIGLHRGEL